MSQAITTLRKASPEKVARFLNLIDVLTLGRLIRSKKPMRRFTHAMKGGRM